MDSEPFSLLSQNRDNLLTATLESVAMKRHTLMLNSVSYFKYQSVHVNKLRLTSLAC